MVRIRIIHTYNLKVTNKFGYSLETFRLSALASLYSSKIEIQRNLDRNIKPMVTFSSILAEKGLRGLYVGAVPRIARRTFQQAITWSLFEFVSKQLGGTGSENWKK